MRADMEPPHPTGHPGPLTAAVRPRPYLRCKRTMRTSEPINLPISVDPGRPGPLRDQITDGIRALIRDGVLPAGARLPSTRTLSDSLKVSRSVAVAAYERLAAAGHIRTGQGSGTYVNRPSPTAGAPAAVPVRRAADAERVIDFTPGRRGTEHFPLPAWRAAWRRAGHRPPPPVQDPLGEAGLRRAVAAYVRDSRGIVCEADQVVIAAGTQAAARCAAHVIAARDGGLACGGPTWGEIRGAFGGAVALSPAAADEEGLLATGVPDSVRHLAVDPDHQPLGASMSQARRRQWLAWARRSGGVLLEHDLYGDFRNEAPPPSLWSMGARNAPAMYLGSLSRLLDPTLQVDYVILSASLGVSRSLLQQVNEPPPPIVQQAVRHLVDEGHLARHGRRMAPLYRRKRDTVRRVLGGLGDAGVLTRTAAGLPAVLVLPPAVCGRTVTRELRRRGVLVPSSPPSPGPPGGTTSPSPARLVLGYTHLPAPDLERGLSLIARVLTEAASS
ncbi:PLP-dependent aminotransferase family protein [Streptomyces sp. NPDC097617]|uniref:aminotransferase-like domain-containing protein n=1 Tax=Streptomyces sp. NPDC097617 TaxID=3366091 RepID=UPI00382E4552